MTLPGRRVRRGGTANSPTLPGYSTKAGLVPDRAHATVLDLTRADATGVDVTTVALRTGIHAGTATSGSFFTKPISVRKGTSVTMKITVAKGFAGAKVQTGGLRLQGQIREFGRGERDSPSLTQRSLSFLMVNATPREPPAPFELVRSA